MKPQTSLLLTVFLLLQVYPILGGTPPTGKSACNQQLQLLIEGYAAHFQQSAYMATMASQNFRKGVAGERMVATLWRKGSRWKLTSLYFTMIADEAQHVVIMHDLRTIVIRNNTDGAQSPLKSSGTTPLDSLSHLAEQIACSNSGELTVTFAREHHRQTGGLHAAELEYDPASGLIKKGTYHYSGRSDFDRQVLEILDYSTNISTGGFRGNALEQITENGKVKPEYVGFELTDLRGAPSND